MIPAFETTFAVPFHCRGCVEDVSSSLYKLDGIQKVSADLATQLIHITGTAAPSAIASTIKDTGRDAILRGSGKPETAAVCILETHSKTVSDPVRGLIRMVEAQKGTTIVDLSIKGLAAGTYNVTFRESGSIIDGAGSTGGIRGYEEANSEGKPASASGLWGTVRVSESGTASRFFTRPVAVRSLNARCIVVSKKTEPHNDELSRAEMDALNDQSQLEKGGKENTLVGIVALSAGVWSNDKTVCSCSGKTVWEERSEQVAKGMM